MIKFATPDKKDKLPADRIFLLGDGVNVAARGVTVAPYKGRTLNNVRIIDEVSASGSLAPLISREAERVDRLLFHTL